MKTKVKSMLINFVDIEVIAHKEFVLEGQSIPHINFTFYGESVTVCEDFAPNFGDKNWLLHHENPQSHTSLITREFFLPKAA
jgi:hypothetical protein